MRAQWDLGWTSTEEQPSKDAKKAVWWGMGRGATWHGKGLRRGRDRDLWRRLGRGLRRGHA